MRAEIEKVVHLIQQDDQKSLEEALALLQETIFSFSMRVCGQRQDAEDTTQEVLLQSVSNLPKFDSPRALVVWLYKVAKTRCLMSRRKSKFAPKEALSLEDLMPDKKELRSLAKSPADSPETALLRRENAKRLRDAVQMLPPEYRIVLVLRDMEELSDADVAEITGLKPGTVRVRLHRARLFVRKHFEKQVRSGRQSTAVATPSPDPARARSCKQMFAELSDYLDDQLDASLCDELEKHMDGCQPCQAFLKSLQRSIEQCRHSPKDCLPPERAAQIRRAVLAQYHSALARRAERRSDATTD